MNSFNIGFVNSAAEKLYPSDSFEWIGNLKREITEAAGKVGVSPGAIAGIMAEERKDYDRSIARSLIGDFIAQYHVDLSAPAIYDMFMDDTGVDALNFLLSLINPTERDHAYWESELAAVDTLYPDINHKPSLDDQLEHPSFIDVGYGNFRIRKAIELIKNNSALSAQLGLDIYTNDYALLVKDMLDQNSDVTAKLYAMYLIEAENWYKANSAYGSNWDSLPVEFKDALLVTFVNLGETQMEKLKQENQSKNDALGYQPVPALGTGGGINHLVNSASIGDVLGLSVYGTKVSAISDIQSLAKNNTPEGLAARYALLNLRPVILPSIDYSTVNQHHELDLYNETTKLGELTPSWIDDRALFLNAKGIYDLSGREDNIVDGNGISNSVINLKDVHFDIHLTLQPSVVSADTVTKNLSFGGRLGDILTGDNNQDRIYGLGGDDKLNGLKGSDVLSGGAGDDELLGGEDADVLFGGSDKDTLDGGEGNDILKGGEGDDTYKFTGNFGRDVIFDTDGSNSLDINGIVSSFTQLAKDSIIYYDDINNPTRKAVLVDEGNTKSLIISTVSKSGLAITDSGNSVTIKNWNGTGFGISLNEAVVLPPDTEKVFTVTANNNDNALSLDNAQDTDSNYGVIGYKTIKAEGKAGNDLIMGLSTGKDTLLGGDGNDVISSGFTDSVVSSSHMQVLDVPGIDSISGGKGEDYIVASALAVAHGDDDNDVLRSDVALYAVIPGENRDVIWKDIQQFMNYMPEKKETSGVIEYVTGLTFKKNLTAEFQEFASVNGSKFIAKYANGKTTIAYNYSYTNGSYTYDSPDVRQIKNSRSNSMNDNFYFMNKVA